VGDAAALSFDARYYGAAGRLFLVWFVREKRRKWKKGIRILTWRQFPTRAAKMVSGSF